MINEMKYMTWKEYEERQDAIIAICVGSVEQHGPHLPMITDAIIPYGMCIRVAEKVDMIVAPEIYYGYRSQPASGGGVLFPGTTSISGETMIRLMYDIYEDFYRQGRKKFLMIGGHYENQSFLAEAAYLFTAKYPDAKVVFIDWWKYICDETLYKIFGDAFPGWEAEHASIVETSLIMYFDNEHVHRDRIPDQKGVIPSVKPLIFPEPKGTVPESGILYTANGASEKYGRLICEEVVDVITKIVMKEF